VVVSGLTNAVAIAAGGAYTCALLSDGTARCWGYNSDGQLGDGTTTQRLTPVAVSGLTNAVAIATGSYHTCALLSDGSARCWGGNNNGQLGDGTTTKRLTPVTVIGLTNTVAIAGGDFHTCVLRSNGTARCWGHNTFGQLGDGTTTQRTTPVTVSGLTNAVAVAGGHFYTCALLSNGGARCWGDNDNGQLGDGTTTERHTPVVVGLDTDGDGCSDIEELGVNELQGGQRDPLDPWDFYDVPTGEPPSKNKAIDLDDALAVLAKFGALVGDPMPVAPPYGEAYDRSDPPAVYPAPGYWKTQAPEGVIDMDDFLWALWQFGHSCFPEP
jgi:hypothetical protein